MMNQLIESFECISALRCLKILLEENLFELLNGPIENSNSNLIWNNFRREIPLEVWMSSLKVLLGDVVLVTLHLII